MSVLVGKVAVITGSSRGLGFAIAQAYAREGAGVVVASRSANSVEEAVEVIQSEGGTASGLACDVTELNQTRKLVNFATEQFGALDIWVNNAGLSSPYGPTILVPPERVTNLINTNILGVYHGTLVAMHHFVPQGKGKLINLIGRGARHPIAMQNAYASSKAWVRNFTLALAKENKTSGVGVYLFNPGLVDTDMMRHLHFVKGYENNVNTFRKIARLWSNSPEVPAKKAVWLASSATDGRTGLEVNLIGPRSLIAGVVREALRLLLGRSDSLSNIEVSTIEPVLERVSQDE